MGKGGNARKQQEQKEQLKRKQREEEEEEQEEEEEDQEEVDQDQEGEDDEEEQIDYFDEEISDEDAEVLGKIDEEILAAEEAHKLSWAAIYNLKKQERELHEKMDEEMRAIQTKYEDLKAPIVDKIARVASGQPVEKELYTEHEYTRTLNVNKYKPKAIENYWVSVLESMGLIDCEQDKKILEHCVGLTCAVINRKREKPGQEQIENDDEKQYQNQEQLSAILKFKDNELIKNKELKLVILKKGEEIEKKEVTAIKFKGDGPSEESLLAVMFNPESEAIQLYEYAQDLNRAYSNSVFFYFYETKVNEIEGDGEEGAEEGAQQGQGQEEDDDAEEDDSDEEDIKPVKKAKKEPNAGLEKPECKQQ